jgi:gamma-glutamylputrescine oxidase
LVTWYEATARRGDCVSLNGHHTVDVCVVGGGLAGLTTALELARRGKSVAVLEAKRIAWGASGRNGGFVSNGFALGIGDVATRIGVEAARKLYDLSRIGTEFVRETIATHDPSIAMGQGMRVCMRFNDGGGLLRYAETLRDTFGETVNGDMTEATRRVLKTERYFDSITFPNAFHIHPLRYALLLQKLAVAQGVKIYEMSPVVSVQKLGNGYDVKTGGGMITAAHVVNCVSSLDRELFPHIGRAVLPVATYVAVTEASSSGAIQTREAVADTRRAGDYYRLIDKDRVLWGGRITTRISEPRRLAESMRAGMAATFPHLAHAKMDYAWAGLMGYAMHKMPLIGRAPDGVWFATAFGGHGLNTTAMAGVLMARAIADGDDEIKRFEPFGPRWAFGPLGRLGVQSTYWWMQARDRFDETFRNGVKS